MLTCNTGILLCLTIFYTARACPSCSNSEVDINVRHLEENQVVGFSCSGNGDNCVDTEENHQLLICIKSSVKIAGKDFEDTLEEFLEPTMQQQLSHTEIRLPRNGCTETFVNLRVVARENFNNVAENDEAYVVVIANESLVYCIFGTSFNCIHEEHVIGNKTKYMVIAQTCYCSECSSSGYPGSGLYTSIPETSESLVSPISQSLGPSLPTEVSASVASVVSATLGTAFFVVIFIIFLLVILITYRRLNQWISTSAVTIMENPSCD